ncbi:TetR-like C-terminal domain-containing protein [Hartmannibacter diazotrophicus]|uniref:TetR-like C-terminal domain-containing protein n=1 Tax=Hartmannibacter diazotrophicus TaxID=1482074 RepID=UPI001FE75803|nr:TetR-like C-terminal domain-containing protein [Hartmannibacter diazotrophicus]
MLAAHDILIEEGFGRLTVEAVSLRSGVGKPTIYRNWANASELAMAALMVDADSEILSDNRPLSEALQAQMRTIVTAFATTRGRQIALTLAASDPESEMTKAFRNRVILSSRENGRRLMIAAHERSEIEWPQNIEVLLDMIYAPVFYRLLVGHLPLDAEFARQVAEESMKLFRGGLAG